MPDTGNELIMVETRITSDSKSGTKGQGREGVEVTPPVLWISVPSPVKSALEILGFPLDRLLPLLSSPGNHYDGNSRDDSEGAHPRTLLGRLLALLLCSLGCANLASGLLALVRAVLSTRLVPGQAAEYKIQTRNNVPGQEQEQENGNSGVDGLGAQVAELTQRIRELEIAAAQASREYTALQRAHDALLAGAARNDAELAQAERSAAALLRETRAHAVLQCERDAAVREALEARAETARCMAALAEMQTGSRCIESDPGHLETFARLQNRRLDSCVFASESELGAEHGDAREDVSDDEIVIVDNNGGLQGTPRVVKSASTPAQPDANPKLSRVSVITAPAAGAATLTATWTSTHLAVPTKKGVSIRPPTPPCTPEGLHSIPVFTTPRPSLPPKVSKTKLKPLLLAARFAVSGSLSARRLSARARKHSNASVNSETAEAGKIPTASPSIVSVQGNQCTLNPHAAAFTPRLHTDSNLPSASVVPTLASELSTTTSMMSMTKSAPPSPTPTRSLFPPPPVPSLTLTSSPNPTSVPVPVRRHSHEPALTPTGVRTPRSTRASSVRLLRARAALRMGAASSSAVVLFPSKAGSDSKLKSDAAFDFEFVSVPRGEAGENAAAVVAGEGGERVNTKTRLVGKGLPSVQPRRALGELTNADAGGAVTTRWASA